MLEYEVLPEVPANNTAKSSSALVARAISIVNLPSILSSAVCALSASALIVSLLAFSAALALIISALKSSATTFSAALARTTSLAIESELIYHFIINLFID